MTAWVALRMMALAVLLIVGVAARAMRESVDRVTQA